jgi:carboxypeptidase Taq
MTSEEPKLTRLSEILAEVSDLRQASAVLDWDQQCYMPSGGAESRGNQLATLNRLAHERFVSDEMGRLLEELQPYAAQLNPDSDEARLLKVTERVRTKQVKVPTEMVVEMSQLTAVANNVWAKARADNDFAQFRPLLEKIVALRQRYAALFAPYDHVYDTLLDDFEPGLKTADVKAIFDGLRPQQVALIQEIASRPQVDDSFLHQKFDEKKQWDFGVEVITKFGYDWEHGRQDKATHPFCTSFTTRDVRITTRVNPEFLNPCLFGTMHETGHALYDMGINPAYDRNTLGGGASLAIHESQSRMWENLVGRSLPFWEHFYPRLQAYFPAELGHVPLAAFYKGINKVHPSLIRVEADEATYNLHIMLRLELEIALMEGSLDVKDLPEAWNTRVQEYLGLTPPTDALGVLQDIHWSWGLIGYFSTYALGNLVSAQLWECIRKAIPNLEDQIRRGEFSALLEWLRRNIHVYGSKYEPQELVQRVTGSKIDPAPYLRYLKTKYSQVYGF